MRVSTDDQVEKYGIPMQTQSLKALIESKGKLADGRPAWQLAGEGNQYVYVDEGISGTVPIDERPAFARLKEDILMAPDGSKPFDTVAVYKIDRFARKLKILLDIIDCFNQSEINFVSANESIDTSTPFGRAMLGIIGIVAELERETILERTQSGREQAALSGRSMSNSINYGYQKNPEGKPVILEEEAEVVRKIFNLFLFGKSPEIIARQLTNEGLLSPEASAIFHKKRSGKAKNKNSLTYWRSERIRIMLGNEIYIGKQYFNKTKHSKALPKNEWRKSEYDVPPIIDPDTFEKVQKKLKRIGHGHKNSPKNKGKYLLSGLLRCDFCCDSTKNLEMAYWSGERKKLDNGNYSRYYNCGRKKLSKSPIQCPVLSLPAPEIEKYITDFCFEIIKSPEPVFKHQQELLSTKSHINVVKQKKDSILSIIQTSESRKSRIKEQHKEGIIGIKELTADLATEDKRIINLKAELDAIDEQLMKENSLEQYTLTLDLFSKKYANTLEEMRNNFDDLYILLHTIIDEIVVIARPVKPEDNVAGKKKEGQYIPDGLHIKLRLPQDIVSNTINLNKGGSGQKVVNGAR